MPTVKIKSISQHKMRRFLELQAAVKEFDALKEEIKGMLKDKCPQQPGRYQVGVSKNPGSRRPPWKDKFIEEVKLGLIDRGETDELAQEQANKAAQKIIDDTKPGNPSVSIHIVDTQADL